MAEELLKFGTLLRATRLGWNWWYKRKCYVRATCLPQYIVMEIAQSFDALSISEVKGSILRSVITCGDEQILDLCEPLQEPFTRDYHCWYVDDSGKAIDNPHATKS